MNEELTKISQEKIESIMYQIENTHFCTLAHISENFTDMMKYLDSADTILTDRIDRIDLKIETVN